MTTYPADESSRAYHDNPPTSRRDSALMAGFDPHPDDVDTFVPGPITPANAQWAHQGSPTGCKDCGERCSVCSDRMCSKWGPEPMPRCAAHPTCADCADVTPCRDCGVVIREAHEGSDW